MKNVFFVPCDHPAAKDGVFHCVPSYYDVEHMRDRFEFIVVDTQKFITQIRQDDPKLLDHAEYKFRGDTAEQWLETTSPEYPRDMGHWSYVKGFGLRMSSGQAALIKLVQEIGIPYFPIAVDKADWATLDELRSKVEYQGKRGSFRPEPQPVYRPDEYRR